ncbi:HNH endonuclease [Leuconostoc gasicomitatum]|uniref:HNH endonuclease n=1 Tax=Leuconostoc gasicomitatum TaxID=115778 RepID=UPI000B7F3CCE
MVELPKHYCAKHSDQERVYVPRDKQATHRYNTVTRNRDDDKRDQYNFYRTKQWVQLRQLMLDEQHYLCQYCKIDGRVVVGKTVDHIVPMEFSPNDKASTDNLAVTCSRCHTIKTKWERSYYGTGQGNTLKRVSPVRSMAMVNRLMKGK